MDIYNKFFKMQKAISIMAYRFPDLLLPNGKTRLYKKHHIQPIRVFSGSVGK